MHKEPNGESDGGAPEPEEEHDHYEQHDTHEHEHEHLGLVSRGEGQELEHDNGIHRVPTFRVILTAACVVENLAPLKGESDEHARSDATFAICQAFNQALALVNESEKMAFNSIDFRIEAQYHPIDKNHPYGGFGEPGE